MSAAGALIAVVFTYRTLAIYRYAPDRCAERGGDPIVITRRDIVQPPPRRETLVVMSFNIQGHAALVRADHVERIAAAIRAADPDIVGLNEVHRWTWQNRFRDQLTEIAARTKMNVVYAPSFRFFGGQFGNAILTRGTISDAAVIDLPAIGEPRSLLGATVAIDGKKLRFYVSHVAAWGRLSQKVRDRQLACIARSLRPAGLPTLLTGDLNAPHEADEIIELARSSGLLNASPKAATHRVMNQAIDYIFISRDLPVRASRVIDEGPSDHRAVIAELEKSSVGVAR